MSYPNAKTHANTLRLLLLSSTTENSLPCPPFDHLLVFWYRKIKYSNLTMASPAKELTSNLVIFPPILNSRRNWQMKQKNRKKKESKDTSMTYASRSFTSDFVAYELLPNLLSHPRSASENDSTLDL